MFFCLFLFGSELVLILSSNNLFTEIDTLFNSKYEYSVVMKSPVGHDNFYQYDATIRFTLNSDSESALKADVIMQSEPIQYGDLVFWSANPLGNHEIAITQSIASANKLNVGDVLYSKHIVDSNVYEYTIKQIVPNAVSVRYEKDAVRNDGVIIMGYDPIYEENISHNVIVFTNEPISVLTDNGQLSAVKMLYRDDELLYAIRESIPYALFFLALGIVGSIIFVFVLVREIVVNFRRYVSLGYPPGIINSSYNRRILLFGCIVELGFIIVNSILVVTKMICLPFTIFLISANLIETIVIITTACIIKKSLWRG